MLQSCSKSIGRELIFLLVSVWRGFLFLLVLVIGCVILLWHSLGIPYNYLYGMIGIILVISKFVVSIIIIALL